MPKQASSKKPIEDEEEDFSKLDDDSPPEDDSPPVKKKSAKAKKTKAKSKAKAKKVTEDGDDEEAGEEETPKSKPAPVKKAKAKAKAKKTATVEDKPKKAAASRTKKSDETSTKSERKTYSLLYNTVAPELELDEKTFKNSGLYPAKNPMQAARKVFSQLARKFYEGNECEISFSIVETNTEKNPRSYKGVREKLKDPETVTRGGQTYAVKYKNVVFSNSKKKSSGEDDE